MKVFIWKEQDNMTDSYHDSGGAVAIAKDLKEARKLFKATNTYKVYDWDKDKKKYDKCAVFVNKPDIVYPVPDDAKPYAEVFPNSGCC